MSSMSHSSGATPPNRGGGVLAAAWLLLIALFAGVAAWVFAVTRGAEAPVPGKAVAAATVSLPPAQPATPPPAVSAVPASAPAPATPRPAPAAVAQAAPVPAPAPVEAPVPQVAPALPAVSSAVPGQPLASVEPALLRDSPYGQVPRLSADRKRAPWHVYAAPFDTADSRPRISVVLTGLGLAKDVTDRAIATLPSQISFSFSPYAAETPNAVAAARQRGHEVLLDLALEPVNYPTVDPGPATLISTYSATDNVARLDWVLARAQGTVGVIAHYGDSFGASAMAMAPVAQALRERGLMYVDNRASSHPAMIRLSRDFAVPWAFADAAFAFGAADEADALVATLHALEKSTVQQRSVVALVPVSPVAIVTLADWAQTVEPRGFALAPVSAVANRQDERDAVRP